MTLREDTHHLASCVIALFTNCSQQRLDNALNLCLVAKALGCHVEFHPDIQPSYAPHKGHPFPSGLVIVDRLAPYDDKVRDLAHEITHHALYWWEWFFVPDGSPVPIISDPLQLKEEVCRGVVEMIGAIPNGLQWNGKLAPPRGTVIRWYRQFPTPAVMKMTPEEVEVLGL